MNWCGLQGKTLDWFKSYLTNRAQRCSVNGCLSDFTPLKCGVPQGTILGFFYFQLILTICLIFYRSAYLECMLMTPTSLMLVLIYILIQSSLPHDLEKLSRWFVSNRDTLNATKTEFMLIGSSQRLSTLTDTLELSIDNVPIEQVSSVKHLGI